MTRYLPDPDEHVDAWLDEHDAELRRLSEVATSGRPLNALDAMTEMRRTVDDLELEVVALARSYRWSWRDIGDAMKVSKSAVQRRFAQFEVPYRRRRQQKGPPKRPLHASLPRET